MVSSIFSAFGMLMPGRTYSSDKYRYGFNGKENDNEVYGIGNQYDYGFRIYNSQLGKFLSVDPLAPKYPFYTPYQFSGNKPISNIDLDGREDLYYLISFNEKTGLSQIKLTNQIDGLLCNCFGANLYVSYGGQTYHQSSFPTSRAGQWFFNDLLGAPTLDDALNKFVGLSKADVDKMFAGKQNVEEMREAGRAQREEEMKELFTTAFTFAVASQTKKGSYTNSIQNSRMSLATKWMGSPSKTQYIDLNKSVYAKTLSKGTKLVQYRIKGQEGTYGDYYALPGTRPEQIGLDPKSIVETYDVTIKSPTSVLFSSHTKNATFYANPSLTVEGGGTQVYSKDLKANATFEKKKL